MGRPLLPLLLALCALVNSAIIKGGVEIPTYTEPCRRNNPDFNRCIRNAVQAIIPKLSKTGIPELDLNSLDPLHIPEILFSYDGSPDIGGKVILKNTYSRGLSTLKVTDVRSKVDDPELFAMDVDFFIPKVVTGGAYKMEGQVARLPIQGKGLYNITMTEVSGTWSLRGLPLVQDGQNFMRITRFGMRPSVGTMKVHATNLVHNNPELSAIALAFINRFWRVLYDEMIPYAEESFDKVARELLNKVFLQIPYDQLFPLA